MEIRVKSGWVESIAGKFVSSRVVDRAKTSGQLNSGLFNFFVHSSHGVLFKSGVPICEDMVFNVLIDLIIQ